MLSRIHAHWASEPYKTFQHAIAACAALLLIFAALVKVGNLPLFARAVVGIVEGRTITVATPQWALVIAASTFALEISVGIALLLAPSESSVRSLGALLFVAFAGVQFRRLGMDSGTPCGCFGMLQGAVFLKPFSTPLSALSANLGIAGGLASIFFPLGRRHAVVPAKSESLATLCWLVGAFFALGFVLARYQHVLWGGPIR